MLPPAYVNSDLFLESIRQVVSIKAEGTETQPPIVFVFPSHQSLFACLVVMAANLIFVLCLCYFIKLVVSDFVRRRQDHENNCRRLNTCEHGECSLCFIESPTTFAATSKHDSNRHRLLQTSVIAVVWIPWTYQLSLEFYIKLQHRT